MRAGACCNPLAAVIVLKVVLMLQNEVMLQPVEPGLLERRVVLDVWDRLQLLLMSGLGAMQHTLR
jgi:hypothetical protein